MLPITLEWVEKAEGDYEVVLLLRKSRKRARHDAICFHSQQCAEKYLKARLTEARTAFDRTHDLGILLNDLAAIEPLWIVYLPSANALSQYAVVLRYPGFSAKAVHARDAFRTCEKLRKVVRESLGLRTH